MSLHATSPPSAVLSPLAWLGRHALAAVAYIGVMGLLLMSAVHTLFNTPEGFRGWRQALNHELSWVLGMGMPLVALVHVGIGSFLAMQAYFGGTFVDGTGAVVGVGLIRNVAPQMACLTLAGLMAARIVPELRARARVGPGGHPTWAADQDVPTERLVAFRLLASVIGGVVLSIWGSAVGIAVGWKVGLSMMGVTTHSFFLMFWEMLWWRDVVGLAVKGVGFGLAAGLFACHEGLLDPDGERPESVPVATCRAACLAALSILVINSSWFLLAYHAGPMFGPTLLTPPTT
jgi:phospholipid/cholesterol/gamma-HCH transport system permease protein